MASCVSDVAGDRLRWRKGDFVLGTAGRQQQVRLLQEEVRQLQLRCTPCRSRFAPSRPSAKASNGDSPLSACAWTMNGRRDHAHLQAEYSRVCTTLAGLTEQHDVEQATFERLRRSHTSVVRRESEARQAHQTLRTHLQQDVEELRRERA